MNALPDKRLDRPSPPPAPDQSEQPPLPPPEPLRPTVYAYVPALQGSRPSEPDPAGLAEARAIGWLGWSPNWARGTCSSCGTRWVEPYPVEKDLYGRDYRGWCPTCSVVAEIRKRNLIRLDPGTRPGAERAAAAASEVARFSIEFPVLFSTLEPTIAKGLKSVSGPEKLALDLGEAYHDDRLGRGVWEHLERHASLEGISPAVDENLEFYRSLGTTAPPEMRASLALAEGAGVIETAHDLGPGERGSGPYQLVVKTALRRTGNVTVAWVVGRPRR